jgi:hypothetical protein
LTAFTLLPGSDCERSPPFSRKEESVLKPRVIAVVLSLLVLVAQGIAADDQPTLLIAKGIIDKIDKETIMVRPRGADGKFEKALVLKITGTSKISTLTTQKRGGKVVNVQRDTEVKDLQPKQGIAIIYTTGSAGTVLLAAVAQPDSDK